MLSWAPSFSNRLPGPVQLTVPALLRVATLKFTLDGLAMFSVLPAGTERFAPEIVPPDHLLVPLSTAVPE